MRGGKRIPWTDAERQSLFKQRAAGVKITEISVPNRTQKSCQQEYYRLRSPETRPSARKRMKEAKPIMPPPEIAASLAAPAARPRYFSDADAYIRARIAAQGLTAGFLGDPPPGRSALDLREGRK